MHSVQGSQDNQPPRGEVKLTQLDLNTYSIDFMCDYDIGNDVHKARPATMDHYPIRSIGYWRLILTRSHDRSTNNHLK